MQLFQARRPSELNQPYHLPGSPSLTVGRGATGESSIVLIVLALAAVLGFFVPTPAAGAGAVQFTGATVSANGGGSGLLYGTLEQAAKSDSKSVTNALTVAAGATLNWKPTSGPGLIVVAGGGGNALGLLGGVPTDVKSFSIGATAYGFAGISQYPGSGDYGGGGYGGVVAGFLITSPVLASFSATGDAGGGLSYSGKQTISVQLTAENGYWQGRLEPPVNGLGVLTVGAGVDAICGVGFETLFASAGGSGGATVRFSELPQVNLRAIEVNQSVQDWNQSVPLLAGKQTLVRVFLEKSSAGAEALAVSGDLRVKRADGSTAMLLTPINPGGNLAVDSITTTTDEFRSVADNSLNFLIPKNRLPAGTLTFVFEPLGVALTCNNAGATQDCELTVTVVSAPNMSVRLLRLGDPDDSTFPRPTMENVQAKVAEVESVFPIATLGYEVSDYDSTRSALNPVNDLLYNSLVVAHREANDPRFGATYGLFVDASGSSTDGSRFAGVADSVPGVAGVGTVQGYLTTSHELGHIVALDHSIDRNLGQNARGRWIGHCGEQAGSQTETFPYFLFVPGGTKKPAIGPMNSGATSLIYGWKPTDASSSELRIVSPFSNHDIMSYCFSPGRFMSKYSYETLRTKLVANNWPALSAGSPGITPAGPPPIGPVLAVYGQVNLASGQVNWLPFRELEGVADDGSADDNGTFLLRVEAANGSVLTEFPFEPDRATEGDSDDAFFQLFVPLSSAPHRVKILRQGQELASREASANAPTVQVLEPNGGQSFSNAPIVVNWSANDADGDSLFFNVAFSPDNGLSWEPLAIDVTNTSLVVEAQSLRGTTTGRFRVSASDGFRCSRDVTDSPVQLANRPPSVSMLSPAEESWFSGDQSVSLSALTYDPEQGSSALSNVVWRSDLDGNLGTGLSVSRRAIELKTGTHLISATITDAQGQTNTAVRQIEVSPWMRPRLFDPVMAQPGSFEFKAHATPATTLVVEQSTDLVHWTEASRVAQTNSVQDVQLPTAGERSFFRVRTEPLPPEPPALFSALQDSIAVVGSPAVLTAPVVGGEPLSMQWYFNDTAVAGATNTVLMFTAVSPTNAGSYHVVVSNASGVLISSNITLDVLGSAFTVLRTFGATNEGLNPWGPLTVGLDGWIYGCARNGGTNNAGVIFKLNPTNGQSVVLRRLDATLDGSSPLGGVLQLPGGELLGTTSAGGSAGAGTIFKLQPDGLGFSVLRHFAASGDCRNPQAPLLLASNGRIYGTAYSGGGFGNGGVFSFNPDGSDYAILTGFNLPSNPPRQPLGGLIEGTNGALYGCTELGGSTNKGTVFRVTTNGIVTVLNSLGVVAGGAENPSASLLLASNGKLYGTAAVGGPTGFGSVFRMELDGSNFAIIRNLGMIGYDAREPRTSLVETPFGTLLGTSRFGGTTDQGAMFQMNLAGLDHSVLHDLANATDNGARSRSPLVAAGGGFYYGATFGGGPQDQGVIFRIFVSELGP